MVWIAGEGAIISGSRLTTGITEPEVQTQAVSIDDEIRVVIVGAGGHGRLALDVLISSGMEGQFMGFYDDAHAVLPDHIRGFPVLGDIAMLKSMLSVESAYVIVAITDSETRLRVANSIRVLGGRFFTAIHPLSYVSAAARVGDGCVLMAGSVVHTDAAVGSHSYLGPNSVIERDAEVGAGAWLSAGSVVGSGARVGARVTLGHNASIIRKSSVQSDSDVLAPDSVIRKRGS